MGGQLHQHNIHSLHGACQDEGQAHPLRLLIIQREKHQVEHPQHDQHKAEEGHVCVHAHHVAEAVDMLAEDGEGDSRHHLGQLNDHSQQHPGAHQVAPADRQGQGIVDILVFPPGQAYKEQPQGGVEKHHIVGIGGDHQHGRQRQKHQICGMQRQAQLLEQQLFH